MWGTHHDLFPDGCEARLPRALNHQAPDDVVAAEGDDACGKKLAAWRCRTGPSSAAPAAVHPATHLVTVYTLLLLPTMRTRGSLSMSASSAAHTVSSRTRSLDQVTCSKASLSAQVFPKTCRQSAAGQPTELPIPARHEDAVVVLAGGIYHSTCHDVALQPGAARLQQPVVLAHEGEHRPQHPRVRLPPAVKTTT